MVISVTGHLLCDVFHIPTLTFYTVLHTEILKNTFCINSTIFLIKKKHISISFYSIAIFVTIHFSFLKSKMFIPPSHILSHHFQ